MTRAAADDRTRSGARPWLILGAVFLALATTAWWVLVDRGLALVPRADQNVLLVTIDSLRVEAVGDDGRVATPALDRLARRGVSFSFAHAHAVTTRPSHASLLTGRLPYEHGIRDNRGYVLAPGTSTLAGRLKAAGFATGAFVGSAHLRRASGLDEGFDVYDDRTGTPPDPLSLDVAGRPADAVVRAAANWLGQQPERWFGWVHLADPHAPYAPGEPFHTNFRSDLYLGEIAAADAALEQLLDHLDEQSRPTLVVVTSDHGEGLGDHGEETHGLFAYEATLRVPLIVAWIDQAATDLPTGGFTVDGPARLIDVVPTVLEAVALPLDAALPGASLGALMDGSSTIDRPTYFEAMSANVMRGWAPLRGVIAGRHKYIDLPVPELYDLRADTGELRNLASVDPARASELRALLDTFDRDMPDWPRDSGPDAIDRLRSIGYSNAALPDRDQADEADDPKRLLDVDRVMDAATLAYEEGRFEEAATALQQVIVDRPDNAEAYLALALVFWQGGVPDQAIYTLQAALHAGLTQGGVAVKLASMLALTTGAPRAIALLEGRTGDDLDALGALGIAYSQVGRSADAERMFEQMLAIAPGSGLAHQNLGILRLRENRLDEAEASLRRAIAVSPEGIGAYTPLGVVLSELGQVEEAVKIWTEAIRLDPTEYLALFNLTVALASLDRTDEARQRGEQFLRTAPAGQYAEQLAQIRNLLGG